mgnify:FL=1
MREWTERHIREIIEQELKKISGESPYVGFFVVVDDFNNRHIGYFIQRTAKNVGGYDTFRVTLYDWDAYFGQDSEDAGDTKTVSIPNPDNYPCMIAMGSSIDFDKHFYGELSMGSGNLQSVLEQCFGTQYIPSLSEIFTAPVTYSWIAKLEFSQGGSWGSHPYYLYNSDTYAWYPLVRLVNSYNVIEGDSDPSLRPANAGIIEVIDGIDIYVGD